MSRKVDYALLILSYLYEREEGGCARAIAAHFDLSRAFVANILKTMCQKGFVTSHRGMKGGYLLLRSADEISLAELMETLDDPFRFAECNQRNPRQGCSLTRVCPIQGPIAAVHDRLREVLRTVTLAQMFRAPDGSRLGLDLLAGAVDS